MCNLYADKQMKQVDGQKKADEGAHESDSFQKHTEISSFNRISETYSLALQSKMPDFWQLFSNKYIFVVLFLDCYFMIKSHDQVFF